MAERCYVVRLPKSGRTLRVYAGKRPTGRTLEALENLFAAATKHLAGLPATERAVTVRYLAELLTGDKAGVSHG
jgi:hypothetical protein